MGSAQELNTAIERIYRTVVDAEAWPAALAAVAAAIGGRGGLLIVADTLTGAVRSLAAGGFDAVFVRRYREEFAARDPWLRALLERPQGTVLSSESLGDGRRHESDPRLQEFLRGHELPAGMVLE